MKGKHIAIIISVILVGGIFFLSRGDSSSPTQPIDDGGNYSSQPTNVAIVDGKQIIEIKAKGGYFPARSTAKADIPTILRVKTNSTFDCSSLLRIPSMRITEILSATETKDIDLGTPKAGILRGTCGMGMYPFEINFTS